MTAEMSELGEGNASQKRNRRRRKSKALEGGDVKPFKSDKEKADTTTNSAITGETPTGRRKRKRVHRGKSSWEGKDWNTINAEKKANKAKRTKDTDKPVKSPKKKKAKTNTSVVANASISDDVAKRKDNKDTLVEKLTASRFRYLNEQLYSVTGAEAEQLFQTDKQAFETYHTGYRHQVKKWPINPLNIIIKQLKNADANLVVADLGCGEAQLSVSVPQTVHSFDLVAANERVTACNMSELPLESESVDVVVFCLSLMGTNLPDYLAEANRILRKGGSLKIAEICSRISSLRNFVRALQRLGFDLKNKKTLGDMFVVLDLTKISKPKQRRPLGLKLQPCLYKKR